MKKSTHRRCKTLVMAAAFFTAGANAELIEYSFDSIANIKRTVSADQKYVNPKGLISFALSAGVDRKVKVSILNDKKTVISTNTGKLIGGEDRITTSRGSFYGEVLTLNTPAEGTYTVLAEILSGDGKRVIQSDEYPLVVDVTKPVMNGKIVRDFYPTYPWTVDVIGLTNHGGTNELYMSAVSDGFSGLQPKAYVYAIDKNGVRRESEVRIAQGVVSTTTEYIANSIMPIDQSAYTVGFVVTDMAGNFSESSQTIKVDKKHPSFLAREVYNEKSKTWEPYARGMTIYANPVKIRDVTYKKDHTEYNKTDYGWWGAGFDFSSPGEFAYKERTGLYPTEASAYYEYHNKAGSYIRLGFSEFAFTPDSSVNLAPETVAIEALIGNKWITRQTRENKPYTISKVRGNVKARNYVQRLAMGGHECLVPVGETSCIINFTKTFVDGRGYEPYAMASGNEDRSWWQHAGYFYNWWDFNAPVIEEITYQKNNKSIAVKTFDTDRLSTNVNNPWAISSHYLSLAKGGETITLNPVSTLSTAYNRWLANFNVASLSDGKYTVKAIAVDSFGNEGELAMPSQIIIDNTKPTVQVNAPEIISSLDQITIDVSDTNDPDATLTSIRLTGGPANDKVSLAWSEVSKGRFKLEYPIIFPTLNAGEIYTLAVTGSDAYGNITVANKTFTYQPRQVALVNGMDGKIQIPAVAHEFVRLNGLSVVQTEPLTLGDGSVVQGNYDVIVSLRSDSEVPVVVNGTTVEPGSIVTVVRQQNFAASGGRINVPIRAAQTGNVGKAHLLITTSAPNSPIALVDVEFWNAEVTLHSDTWEYRQVIDPLKITAHPAAGSVCRLTLSEALAKKADPISDPVCLLEWIETPDEADISVIEVGGSSVAGLSGQAMRLGLQNISFNLFMFSADTKVQVGQGAQEINVVSAVGAIEYQPTSDLSQVNRTIQKVDVQLKQSVGPACELTINAEEAIKNGAIINTKNRRTCLLEWLEIPAGLNVSDVRPTLSGYLTDPSTEGIKWRVSTYSKTGNRVNLGEQFYAIKVVNPPKPTIKINSKYWVGDQLVVPSDSSLVGDVGFKGEPADMTVVIKYGETEIENEDFIAGWVSTPNTVNRLLDAPQAALWDSTPITLTAFYSKLPDVLTTQTVNLITSPPKDMAVELALDKNKTLDTELFPVSVSVYDGGLNRGEPFDAAKHGHWKVRIYQQPRAGDKEPIAYLTDFVELDENGKGVLNIDMKKVEGDSAKLLAEAVLIHEIEGYNRVLQSRTAFVTVLYGGDVAGNAIARKLSGPAPYPAYFQFVPSADNKRAARALGEVFWEVSNDDGQTWERSESNPRPVMSRTFDKGTYLIKATSTNRYSGETYTSETIELIAYDKPKTSLKGPSVLLTGDTAVIEAESYLHGEPVDIDDYLYFWSVDKGQTFIEGENTFTISEDSPAARRVMVKVRAKEAPLDDQAADAIARTTVTFKPVSGPRVGLTVPNKVEVGKTYLLKALARPPYAGMKGVIKGYFTLPDGSEIEGTEVEYTPNQEDESLGRVNVEYTAYVEGFRDSGAETKRSTSMRVWEYVWPDFKLAIQGAGRFAPAKLNLNLHQVASATVLEEPVYTWEFPEGTEIISERNGRAEVMLHKVGESKIKVTVQDARGFSSEVEETLNFEFAEPFEIDLPLRTSNPLMRETLTVTVRPEVSGGHPKDRVAERKFFLNGELLQEGGTSARAALDAGKHVIGFELLSRYGQVSTGEVEFEVNANKPPVCTVSTKDSGSSWRFTADCTDEDGRISAYNWEVNGVEAGKAKSLSIVKSKTDGLPTVTVTATDDSGGVSNPVTHTVTGDEVEYPEDQELEKEE